MAIAAVMVYLLVEVVSLGITRSPSLPLALLAGDVLGLGADGALIVLAGAVAVMIGVEGIVLGFGRAGAKAVAAGKEGLEAEPVPGALERSSLNRMLDDSSRNFVEVFPLKTGALNVYGAISKEEGVEGYRYVVIEPELSEAEQKQFGELKELLIEEMDVDLRSIETKEKAEAFLSDKVADMAERYGFRISKPSMRKLQYYFTRDFIHLGKIDPLMLDPLIEDISCDGAKIPIYVWHRDYESIPTNVVFESDRELDTFVSKLAYVSGKHISLASPLVDASLHDGSRLHLTYGKEVTQRGSTFTIRKFKADPFTIIDLIKFNTLNSEAAAYLWYLVEKRLSMLVSGGTACGKTTSLNCLSMFISPGQKVISIEDTAELNLPQENWIQEVSRAEGGAGEITLFDLVRNALRQRPDVIIVGEIRGKEAFTLFQAISSVSGDTPVLIRENGGVSLRPISEFVDRYYRADAERVPIPVEGPEVLSFDNKGSVQFYPVRYVLRHKASEIYGLRYKGGLVRATGSHSVFVFDENCKIVPKAVSELNSGDIMVSFIGSNLSHEDHSIDVKSELIDAVGRSIVESRPKANCPHCNRPFTKKAGLVNGKQRYWCYSCERKFKEQPDLTFVDELGGSSERLVAFEKSLPLPANLKVDTELARVLGVYLADGCVKHHGNSARVVFTLGTPEKGLFVEDLVKFFAKFGSRPSVDDRGTYAIYEFNHSVLAEVIESLCGKELSTKKVPEFLWTSRPEIVQALVSGWNADGRRTISPRWTAISSVRRDLISAISWLARLNGMTTFISERNSNCPAVWVSKSDSKKSSRAIPAAPLHRLAKLLDSPAWVHMPKRTARTISKKRARQALEEILRTKKSPLTWDASKLATTIAALIEGTLVAAPVLSITKEPYEGYVYDLSVPGTEAFFGGDTPAALHNTGHGGLGTIHADSVEAVFNRLTTEPMNLPRSIVGTSLDCIVLQLKLRIGDRSVRRIVSINEILGYDNRTNEMVMNEIYRWDPVADRLMPSGRSRLVEKINQRYGLRPEEIRRDLESRKVFLEWLASKNYRSYREVSQYVQEFYGNPYAMASRARTELEARV